jgi:hypothetical protein
VAADAGEGAEPSQQRLAGGVVRPEVPGTAFVVADENFAGSDDVPRHDIGPRVQGRPPPNDVGQFVRVGRRQLKRITGAEALAEPYGRLPGEFTANSLVE